MNVWSANITGGETRLTNIRGFTFDGDSDSDGVIGCGDLAIIRASYGRRAGQAGFDARADVNRDGLVNVTDLSFVSRRLSAGTVCP
jgi:hypothetical protein